MYRLLIMALLSLSLSISVAYPSNPIRVSEYKDGLAVAKEDKKLGFIDLKGKIVIPLIYDVVYQFTEGLAAVQKDKLMGYIDRTGKMVIALTYSDALPFVDGLAGAQKDDKWGFINKKGQFVIPPRFRSVVYFNKGTAYVEKMEPGIQRWGQIDRSGKLIRPFRYKEADILKLAPQLSAGTKVLYTWYNQYGSTTYNPLEAVPQVEELFEVGSDPKVSQIVNEGEHYGVKRGGEVLIPIEFDQVYKMDGGLYEVKKADKRGYYSSSGKQLFPPISEVVSYFHNGIVVIKVNGKSGYLDSTGRQITPLQYDEAMPFAGGIGQVMRSGKWAAIDRKGHEIIPFIHDRYSGQEGRLPNDLISAVKDGKTGFYSIKGELIVPFKFANGYQWGDGLVCVQDSDTRRWGFINQKGVQVIPCQYANVAIFENGLASVHDTVTGKMGMIDKTNNIVIPFKYDFIARAFYLGLINFRQNDKWGYLNGKGKEVIPAQYLQPVNFHEETVPVTINGTHYFQINRSGKCVKGCL
jgi:hypothetical protein